MGAKHPPLPITTDPPPRNWNLNAKQVPIEPGENWAGRSGGGVRKLVLRHEQEGVLGTIYLDLHR